MRNEGPDCLHTHTRESDINKINVIMGTISNIRGTYIERDLGHNLDEYQ